MAIILTTTRVCFLRLVVVTVGLQGFGTDCSQELLATLLG